MSNIPIIILAAFFPVFGFGHDSTRPGENAKEGGVTQRPAAICKLQVELIDRDTLDGIAGMIRIMDQAGNPIRIPELLDRCIGLPRQARKLGWHVLNGPTEISAPRRKLTIEAVSGLEYTRIRNDLDLTDQAKQTFALKLTRFWNAKKEGLVAGNTHLHLKDLTRKEADQYLQKVSRADGLDVVFVSYLERALVDRTYITNQHSRADLEELSTKHVHFGNGQEYRHNLGGGGQGYGHVMFLDLKKKVLPGSVGPGITKMGTDGTPLRGGIKLANSQNATVVWCHNQFGFEDIPSWIAGLVQAQNIFDGGNQGSYEDSFYRYLNLGIRVPFSTGTDWFIYDYSRVYVDMENSNLSVANWLSKFREGRTFITNGPILNLTVNSASPGETIKAERSVKVRLQSLGREKFASIELIKNGKVIPVNLNETKHGGWTDSTAEVDLPVSGPTWIALRLSPHTTAKNEFGRKLFAHTSPVYVNTSEGEVIDPTAVEQMITEVETNLATIREQGTFASDQEKENVSAIYEEAIRKLRSKLSP